MKNLQNWLIKNILGYLKCTSQFKLSKHVIFNFIYSLNKGFYILFYIPVLNNDVYFEFPIKIFNYDNRGYELPQCNILTGLE